MSLYLVRHAEPLSSGLSETDVAIADEDDGLSQTGHAQARRLAHFLAGKLQRTHVSLLCSPMRRARQTCAYFEHSLTLHAVIDVRLAERSLALAAGTSVGESRAAQLRSYANPHNAIGQEESVAQHRRRVDAWFAECAAELRREPTRNWIVVCHGGTMEHIMAGVVGADAASLSRYFFDCPCACYHQLTPLFPKPDWMVWRIDAVSANAPAG